MTDEEFDFEEFDKFFEANYKKFLDKEALEDIPARKASFYMALMHEFAEYPYNLTKDQDTRAIILEHLKEKTKGFLKEALKGQFSRKDY